MTNPKLPAFPCPHCGKPVYPEVLVNLWGLVIYGHDNCSANMIELGEARIKHQEQSQ